MAWGSAGKAIEAANQERGAARSAARQGSNLDERYPMYVVPVQEVKTWDRWVAHQDLLARGKLKVFDESMWGKVYETVDIRFALSKVEAVSDDAFSGQFGSHLKREVGTDVQ